MSHVYQGGDMRAYGAGGTRAIPDGLVAAEGNPLRSGHRDNDRTLHGSQGGVSERVSYVEEATLQEIASTVASKFCATDGCKAYHLKESPYCVGHHKGMFDRRAGLCPRFWK